MPTEWLSRHAHHAAATADVGWFGGCSEHCRRDPLASARFQEAGPERPFWATRQMPSPTCPPTYGARDGRGGCACPAPPAAAAAAESAALPKKQFLAAAVTAVRRRPVAQQREGTAATSARRISAVVVAAAGSVCVAVDADLGQWDRRP